jgi:hypothetical protein
MDPDVDLDYDLVAVVVLDSCREEIKLKIYKCCFAADISVGFGPWH